VAFTLMRPFAPDKYTGSRRNPRLSAMPSIVSDASIIHENRSTAT